MPWDPADWEACKDYSVEDCLADTKRWRAWAWYEGELGRWLYDYQSRETSPMPLRPGECGECWVKYRDEDAGLWHFYDGPFGKFWSRDGTLVEPFVG